MIISLGIESSCDDTSIAIVNSNKEILSNIVVNQFSKHALYKGVVPEIASRSHLDVIQKIFHEALSEANITPKDLSIICATGGPGLIGGVIVGTMFAKSISSALKKPYLAINHLEGHALTARLTSDVKFPYMLLLASGGHCQILEVKSHDNYKLLSKTLDDAAGEAFDKVAKMLDLGFPGGPEVERRAKFGNKNRFHFPTSMCNKNSFDMSFSGIKTSVKNTITNLGDNLDQNAINDICASFQHTILKIFLYKLEQAFVNLDKNDYSKTIVISGGVAANKYITENINKHFCEKDFDIIYPPQKLCTDNAAMIAWAGIEKYKEGYLSALDFCPKSRWNLF